MSKSHSNFEDEGAWLKCSNRLRRIEFLNIIYLIVLPVLTSRVIWLEFKINNIHSKYYLNSQSAPSIAQYKEINIKNEESLPSAQSIATANFFGYEPSEKAKTITKKDVSAHNLEQHVVESRKLQITNENARYRQRIDTTNMKKANEERARDTNFERKLNILPKVRRSNDPRNYTPRKKSTRQLINKALRQGTLDSQGSNTSICSRYPMLSPISSFNNFTFDATISRTLDLIYSLSSMEAVHKAGTPQFMSTCWIIYDDLLQSKEINRLTVERYVFGLILYSMDNEANMPTSHICDYDPDILNCTENGFVSDIRFSGSPETTFIPSEIFRFQFLETLDLSSNGLVGPLPTELGNLLNLNSLYLNNNHITGTIPSELGNLHNLEHLNLQLNSLSGAIPFQLGQCIKLEFLAMDRNLLEGSIPNSVFECKSLKEISLFLNRLSGSISSKIGNLHHLDTLYLGVNNLSGSIPSETGNLPRLKYFHANTNQLNGSLPEEIGNLRSLQKLWLNDNFLTGSLPDVFEHLNDLFSTSLSNNRLSGPIPTSLLQVEKTKELYIQMNKITGIIPDEFCEGKKFDFASDLSEWFLDSPKVTCECCDRVDCLMWDLATRPVPCFGGVSFEYTHNFEITDQLTGSHLMNSVGEVANVADICLSATGCFEVKYYDNNFDEVMFNLSYSSNTQSLMQQDQCDAVEVCGIPIDETNSKRVGLNHLMQIAVSSTHLQDPDSPQAKALCWLMSKDQLFHEFSICDGTLLQRYVLAVLLFESLPSTDFDDLASKHTCDWKFVKCSSSDKFIYELVAPNENLVGTLISELGFLVSLETIDFRSNNFTGTIDSSILENLMRLETLDVDHNKLTGTIPENLFTLPRLKHVSLSHNKFIGSISNDTIFPILFESFNISSNLVVGQIPVGIVDCMHLKSVDMSQNSLTGFIPIGFGEINHLEVIKLDENRLRGSIPAEIFNAQHLRTFFVQSNDLTSSIPNEITKMVNAAQIALDHNSLKGSIPLGLGNLTKLSLLHLHQNFLSGTAPSLSTDDDSQISYIVDCGNPAYLLPKQQQILCPTCTICCNSDGMCQENMSFHVMIFAGVLFAVPFVIVLLFFTLSKAKVFQRTRDPTQIYSDNSVYCFIFTKNFWAWIIHLSTAMIQFMLFWIYLQASNLQSKTTDWQFTIRCPNNTVDCENSSTRSWVGWTLFAIITVSFLGADLSQGFMQLHVAIANRDLKIFFSGFLLLSLTLMAFYASIAYNLALASTNTDLIMNAVILLFINDLDEQILHIVETLDPKWAQQQIDSARAIMESKRDVRMNYCFS